MKKTFVLAAAFSAALSFGAMAAEMAKLSADSTMGALMDNAKAKEVLTKHLPDIVSNPQMEQAKDMTLRSLQQFAPAITDDKLKAIDADLAKIK